MRNSTGTIGIGTMDQETLKALSRIRTFALTGQAIPEVQSDRVRLDYDQVYAFKSDSEVMQTRDFYPVEELKAATRVGERTFSFVWSTETPDHGGDIVKASGWDLSVFRTNPVALWSHNGSVRPPVGRGLNARKGIDVGGGIKGLAGDIELAPAGASDFTDALYNFVDAGMVRATSVGFRALTVKEIRDEKERERLGLGRWGAYFEKQLLLEISLVSLPQNPEALGKAAEEFLSSGTASKRGIEEVIKAWSIPEREHQRIVDELCKEIHALSLPFSEALAPERVAPGDVRSVDLDATLARASDAIEAAKKSLDATNDPKIEGESESVETDSGNAGLVSKLVEKGMAVLAPPGVDLANVQCQFTTVGTTGNTGTWVQDPTTDWKFIPWSPPLGAFPGFISMGTPTGKAAETEDRVEKALERIEAISTKQDEVIASLSDLIERLMERRTANPMEAESSDTKGIIAALGELSNVFGKVRATNEGGL